MITILCIVLLLISFNKGRFVVPVLLFGLPYIVSVGVIGVIRTGVDVQAVLPLLEIGRIATGVGVLGLLYTAIASPAMYHSRRG
jgi:hypothetical protein